MKNSKKTWEYTREIVFERLDRRMREDKLYLDYSMTLPKLSEMTDVQEKNAVEPEGGDPDEFANSYGFRTRRSLDRILVKETGCTYRKILRRRNRSK